MNKDMKGEPLPEDITFGDPDPDLVGLHADLSNGEGYKEEMLPYEVPGDPNPSIAGKDDVDDAVEDVDDK